MSRWLALALIAGILGGCVSDPSATPDQAAPAERGSEPPEPVTQSVAWEISYGVGAAGYSVRQSAPTTGSPVAFFSVPANTTRLVVDSTWTCLSAPLCGVKIALFVGESGGDQVAQQESNGPSHIGVKDPPAGPWRVIVYPAGSGSAVLLAKGTSNIVAHFDEA